MNDHFNWYRLGLLIRNDFVAGYRLYLNAFAVLAIIMMLNAIPAAGLGHLREDFYYGWFTGLLIIWGSIHASLMFRDKKLNEAYLLIPASALEKTLARYMNSSVFFILHMLIFVTVTALLLEGINMILFARSNGLFNPFHPAVWDRISAFMVIQPVFFLGSACFRSSRWFKTIITIFIINTGLGILGFFTFFITFLGHFDELHMVFNQGLQDVDWGVNIKLFEGIITGLKILCFGVLPPFCVYVSWLRVKETQVSYGV